MSLFQLQLIQVLVVEVAVADHIHGGVKAVKAPDGYTGSAI